MAKNAKFIDKNIVDSSKAEPQSFRAVREFRTKLAITGPSSHTFMIERLSEHVSVQVLGLIILLCVSASAAVFSFQTIGLDTAILFPSILFFAALSAALIHQKFKTSSKKKEQANRWLFIAMVPQLLACVAVTLFAAQTCGKCESTELWMVQLYTVAAFNMTLAMSAFLFMKLSAFFMLPPTILLAFNLISSGHSAQLYAAAAIAVSFFWSLVFAHKMQSFSLKKWAAQVENKVLQAEMETQQVMAESARSRAEEANLAKSRFLATMSHELRTPLNAILGFSSMMKDEILGPLNNEKYKEYSEDIHNSGSHLLNVINEILDISRIEAGKHQLNEEKLSLVSIVNETRRLVEVKASEKNITLKNNFEPELPTIWVDEKAIRKISLNLLSNAIKFTPSNGVIELKIGWTSGGGQYISIKDSGPGIPEEEIPIILSSFGQGSIAIHSAEAGTGLGLTIVQSLLGLHQGRFEIKSKLREGTEVLAFFPKERVTIASQGTNEDNQKAAQVA